MKEQWKRNAVVATVLLFVCAAVYLNWRYAGDVGKDAAPAGNQNLSAAQEEKEGESGKDGGVTTKVLGDAALVGGVPTKVDDAMAAGGQLGFLVIVPFVSLWKYVLAVFCGAGLVIGILGSLLAIRRFLHV